MKKKISFHKQYLCSLLFSRNAKKPYKDQSMLQTFSLCLKSNIPQIFTISSHTTKEVFPKCVYHLITGGHYFLCKFMDTQWFGATPMLLQSSKQVF